MGSATIRSGFAAHLYGKPLVTEKGFSFFREAKPRLRKKSGLNGKGKPYRTGGRQSIMNGRNEHCPLTPLPTVAYMINFYEKDGRLTFNVRVVPRASRSEIAGEHDGALRIRLAAPPVNGAANEELIRILARALKVSRTSVTIITGPTSKLKKVAVNGIGPEVLQALTEKK